MRAGPMVAVAVVLSAAAGALFFFSRPAASPPAAPASAPAPSPPTPQANTPRVVDAGNAFGDPAATGRAQLQAPLRDLIGSTPLVGDPRVVDPPLAKTASEVLAARRGELVRCYAPVVKEGGTLKGKVVLKMSVNPMGAVFKMSNTPATTVKHAAVVSCVMATIKGWTFPKAQTEVLLEVPIEIRQVQK